MPRILLERLFYHKILVKVKVYSTGGESMNRSRQARWDALHLHTISTRLPEAEAFDFKFLCALCKTTPYSVLQQMIREWVQNQVEA